MRISDAFAGLIGLLFSAFTYWRTLHFPEFSITTAGPRFFPQLLAVLLGGLSAFLLGQSIVSKGKVFSADRRWQENQSEKRARFLKVLSAIVGSIVYLFAMREIGFLISTFLYFGFLMFLMQEEKRILRIIPYAITITAVSYVIFAVLLKASLPIGAIFR